MKIPVHRVETVAGEIEAMQRQIASRAEQLHDEQAGGGQVQDWLVAEHEMIWRPALEVQQTDDTYVVEAAVAGVEPQQIDVQVAPNEILIRASVHHGHRHTGDALLCEFSPGPLFRSYHFTHPVDPAHAHAEYRNGLLRITAPLSPARGI